ncbi:putative tricarboxylic transport membrane protein [Devosia crocina]|uniref:Putative tricarboxylic transport membrane protein n=1 Tax=Devosia crocina TaxID=429728 RepID=A0A1I7NVI9_9HYPH|nr:tripartite tricarboxylate transporter TctB family protein [Devosia crocina]SFV38660.1 putative tricarboxylic transport membrane protein [Devosia crocina]
MQIAIRNPKDLLMGLLYFLVGGAGLLFGRDYAIGTAANMGPGFFPFYLSCLLLIFAVVSWARGFLLAGEPVGPIAWKAIALIAGTVIAFGFLLERAGLAIAMPLLLVTAAMASDRFRLDWRTGLGVVAFTALCAALFTYGLGLPIPVLGSWFG